MGMSKKDSWINAMLLALKDKDEMLGKSVLEECGRQCSGNQGMLDEARALGSKVKDLSDDEKFLYLKKEFSGNGVSYHKESGMIYIEYDRCICALRDDGTEYDQFLCHCTKGFAKELMSAVFNHEVEITILKTVLKGDDKCLLAVRLV